MTERGRGGREGERARGWKGIGTGLEKWFQRWRGLGLGGPRGKGSPSVSKGPKSPIQLLQLLRNSPREVRRAHFCYILGPPGPTQEMEFMGPRGEGHSRSPVSPAMDRKSEKLNDFDVGTRQFSHGHGPWKCYIKERNILVALAGPHLTYILTAGAAAPQWSRQPPQWIQDCRTAGDSNALVSVK